MNDLKLWRMLGDESLSVDVALLEQLAELPLRQRFPFFGRLSRVFKSENSQLRQAGYRTLRGAHGLNAFRWLVAGLSDDDPAVRRSAVEALRVSAAKAPSRWAHALFHHHQDVRQTAVAGDSVPGAQWLNLFLLADPGCADQVLQSLATAKIPLRAFPAILEFSKQGKLSNPAARRIIADLPIEDLNDWLATTPLRTDAEVEMLLSMAADNTLTSASTESVDLLDQLCDLFWEPEAGKEVDPATGFCPLNAFFEQLSEALITNRVTDYKRITAALLIAALRQERWVDQAAEVCTLHWPYFLSFECVPRGVRYRSIRALYAAGKRCTPLPETTLRPLLDDELFRRPSGSLDLWAIGGLLHRCENNPIALLLRWFRLNPVVSAFLEDPEHSAPLFSLPDNSENGRQYLIEQISKKRKKHYGLYVALLVHAVNADGLQLLDPLSAPQAVEVFAGLLQLARRPEMSLGQNKSRIAGRILATKMVQADDPQFAKSFLELWMDVDDPRQMHLGLEMLTVIARESTGLQFVEWGEQLSRERLRNLLHAIVWCPGFPYGTEMQLARTLADHSNSEIREWANSRIPETADIPAKELKLSAVEHVASLSTATMEKIATCAEADLSSALWSCLASPHRGLCPALSRRDEPTAPSLSACISLLACHDPMEDLADQFVRFGSEDPSFLEMLDERAVAAWEPELNLPLAGHSWLHRWDRHCDAIACELVGRDENMLATLQLADALSSSILQRQIWRAVSRVVARWRWREREQLRRSFPESLGDYLVDSLSGAQGDLAAQILMKVFDARVAPETLARLQPEVIVRLPAFAPETRAVLQPWVDSRGLSGEAVVPRAAKQPLDPATRERIAQCNDLDQLEDWCLDDDPGIVDEAALRLVELSDDGAMRLVKLLQRSPLPPSFNTIAGTVSLWPDAGALDAVRRLARAEDSRAELKFLLGCEFMARGESEWLDDVLRIAASESNLQWFRDTDWLRLVNLGVDEEQMAQRLAPSSQSHAYTRAVHFLLEMKEVDSKHLAAMNAFLECGTERGAQLRVSAARWLKSHDDIGGYPLMLESFAREQLAEDLGLLQHAPAELVDAATTSCLAAGALIANESLLLDLVEVVDVDPLARDAAYERVLAEGELLKAREKAVDRLKRSRSPSGKLRRVAQRFALGVRIGRELTGRLFAVDMIGGEDLGYTRLEQNRIFISPLPILRREQHGEEVVDALILHELGHHMYHRGEHEQEVWKTAENESLFKLLNLVSDEHLERNLRAKDRGFGNKLKRLAAYAFQRSHNEVSVEQLLGGLQARAFEVLTRSKLRVARDKASVAIDNGQLLFEMERAGMSFPRFFRALRMGLGNRHDDPKVDEALALFKMKFRKSSMDRLLDIARELRRIFGDETCLLDSFGQDAVLGGDAGDLLVHGEGATNEDLQEEIRRISDASELPRGEGSGGGGPRTLNVIPNEDFQTISTVLPVEFDREQHAVYARQVARHARRMRHYLQQLGIALVPQRRRTSGKRLDRTRIRDLVLRGDPRMLIARQARFHTDLFLGVLIDCSSSMTYGDNIERAKLFGVMLAEAAKNYAGIDLRLFGFTDSVIYDAGDANRPAVHALVASGGNNDAAALWHAAQLARASQRSAKLLVMISDGLPTECSVDALRALVTRITNRMNICCAQVAVQPLEEVCFPHYVELQDKNADVGVRRFGEIIARLVQAAMSG